MTYAPATNTGHGHVWERPDGVKARCGGPGLCEECSADSARRREVERQLALSEPAVRTASFRLMHSSPGHATYGVWVNGGKCGNLVVRQAEREAFEAMMQRGGFTVTPPSTTP